MKKLCLVFALVGLSVNGQKVSDECLFKLEGPLNGIFQNVFGVADHNLKPVWHLVDPATGNADTVKPVSFFWSELGQTWNIGSYVDDVATVYGIAKFDANMICPPDGSRYMTDPGTGYIETGYIYRLMTNIDGMCSPSGGSLVSPVLVDTLKTATTLSECARSLVLGPYSSSTALSLVGGKCMATNDPKVSLDTSTTSNTSCLKRCNVLNGWASLFGNTFPGDMKGLSSPTTYLECAAAAFQDSPLNNGFSFSDTGNCERTALMETASNKNQSGYLTCFIGPGADLTVAAVQDVKPLPQTTAPPVTTAKTSVAARCVNNGSVVATAIVVALFLV